MLRALSSYSPSLGIMAANHHFTVAQLFSLTRTPEALTEAQVDVLDRVAPERLLIASGWAEGRPQSALAPNATATAVPGGFVVNGSKRPCSSARSMDVLTASVAVPVVGEDPALGVALIPASSPGISVHPFWSTSILNAGENEEIRLTDVFVPDDLVIRETSRAPELLKDLLSAGFIWFNC